MAAPSQHMPPQNVEAEESVLGAMLVAEPTLSRVIIEVGLESADFYLDRHRAIFDAISALFVAGRPVSELSVIQQLKENGTVEEAGGIHYVSELAAKVPAAGNAKHYAEIVEKESRRRRMLGAAQEMASAAADPSVDIEDVLASAEAAVLDTFDHRRAGPVHIRQGLSRVVDRQEAMASGEGDPCSVATGFTDLDELIELRPGTMGVVAARPSMGKSVLVTNIVENAALRQDRAVLFQSLEMSEEELVERMLSSQARVPLSRFRKGRIPHSSWSAIVEACNRFEKSGLWIDDSGGLTSTEISMRARTLHRRLSASGGLDLIVVDYLQQLKAPSSRMTETEAVSDASRALKALAKDLGVPVLVVSQLSRAPELRPDKRPQLSDLRQSGQIEQDADVVMLMFREDYYDPETEKAGIAEVNIAKQRNGPVGRVELRFQKHYVRFRDYVEDPLVRQASAFDEAA